MDGWDIDEQKVAGSYLIEPFLLHEELIECIGHLHELEMPTLRVAIVSVTQ